MAIEATIAYDSGTVYKIQRVKPHERFDDSTPLTHTARLYRLGPDGWHRLELLDASSDGGLGAKSLDTLIDDARDVIESTYEDRDAALRTIRELDSSESGDEDISTPSY